MVIYTLFYPNILQIIITQHAQQYTFQAYIIVIISLLHNMPTFLIIINNLCQL